MTDPMGNVSTSVRDPVGRAVASTDAQGNTVKYQYNALNLPTQVTDASGNNTSFTYDGNGNLLSLTDAANHTTSYTYNNMDQVQTRTDPLLRQESYNYDLNGNVVSATDRKGQVTTFSYDALNRLKFAGFNTIVNGSNTTYESTISYTYDAGNRMTQVVDSAGGTITRGYDTLDRLTSETTAQGSISYGYDNASRLTSVQVAGQPQATYTYDNADRLTQISQSGSSTSFGYDISNRRTSLTLPNGLSLSYSYDNGSRLTGITYQFGTNTLGSLAYTYDPLAQRTQVGGSLARTGLPGQMNSATYDAANELTNWNGTVLAYDANGNMLGDGTNSFTWNARNQVAKLNNVSLQYDTFGRRTQNLTWTSFLYNGANAVQELSGSTVTANLVSAGVDEVFSRTDSSGAFTPLKDALGSAIGLVDSSGNVQTSYTYDAFGNTSVTGTANANEFQYTGRENEGNGLYYYRARYYSPLLGRFISEDPLGLSAGPNVYVYALGNPISFSDPSGLCSDPGGWGIRYCVQAFIPETHVGGTGFQGDGRGPQPNGGTYRFGQDVYNRQSWLPNIDSYGGISHWGPFGRAVQLKNCDGTPRFLPKLHGRKIHLHCAASDAWLFGAAPDAGYDLTITESLSGTAITGTATVYPSIEVWQYGNGDPKLVFYQDGRSTSTADLPFPQQVITPTFTPWQQ